MADEERGDPPVALAAIGVSVGVGLVVVDDVGGGQCDLPIAFRVAPQRSKLDSVYTRLSQKPWVLSGFSSVDRKRVSGSRGPSSVRFGRRLAILCVVPGEQIHPDLLPLAFPIDRLSPLPGNPRRGDVDAVVRSYSKFGQRKPIVARRQGAEGTVIAGNHQLVAARRLGWERIAVVWVDDDEITAKAFALADNRTSDLGDYDQAALEQMIADVADDVDLLAATSYALDGVSLPDPAEDQSLLLTSAWAVMVVCRDEAEQTELLARLSAEGRECRALTS